MASEDKSVFVSYRRPNMMRALAISQKLSARGYDVYFDHGNLHSGDAVSFDQIRRRWYFLILLTPTALDPCDDPNDPIRREIEIAMSMNRAIVLLFFEGASLRHPSLARHLTGRLANLQQYPVLDIGAGQFDTNIKRLCDELLNMQKAEYVLASVDPSPDIISSSSVPGIVEEVQIKPGEEQAWEWYKRGETSDDIEEEIRCYTEAIRLKPDLALAYGNRGVAYSSKGDWNSAIQDCTSAIIIKPDNPAAYGNRGYARLNQDDVNGALQDCNTAIGLRPDYALAYNTRGQVFRSLDELDKAIQDYTRAIELNPFLTSPYINRGDAYIKQGKFDAAIRDCTEAIHLQPDSFTAFNNRSGAYYGKRDFDKAIDDLSEVIRIRPDLLKIYKTRAVIFLQISNYASGVADLQQYLDLGGGVQYGDQAEVERLISDMKARI